MLSPGSTIGRYVVSKKLAEGGMAEVYLASAVGPEGFAKEVVIKVVRSFLANDQQFIDLFIAEARLSSKLNHANVVQIFDFGKVDDSYYLAMEYVRGASLWELRKRCRERGVPFPPTLAAEIGAQVARGLQYAHSLTDRGQPLGLVHRDVTPHNVLLSFDGAVKLTDFGIAKAGTSQTAPGILKGKFAYMSPEQARGDAVDARTDVFALGIVLWELLTGGRLFDADSEIGVLRAVQQAAIVPPSRLNPDVPDDLSDIVIKALARPLDERFQTAFDLERALANYVLRHAATVEDTSTSAFLQQQFQDDYHGTAGPEPAEGLDELSHGPTLAVKRNHALTTPDGPPRRAESGDETLPRREPVDPSLKTTDQQPGVPASISQRLRTLKGDSPSPGLSAAAVTEPGADASNSTSESAPAFVAKPKTDVMPAHRPSRRLPLATAAAVPESSPSPAPVSASSVSEISVVGRPSGMSTTWVVTGVVLLAGVAAALAWFVAQHDGHPLEVARAEAPTEAPSGSPTPTPSDPPVTVDAEPPSALPEASPDSGAAAPVPAAPRESDKPAAPTVAAEPPRPAPARPTGARVAAQGTLDLRAVPFAMAWLDGRSLGEVNGFGRFKVNAGLHDLKLVHPRLTKTEHVTIKSGETTTLTFDVSQVTSKNAANSE